MSNAGTPDDNGGLLRFSLLFGIAGNAVAVQETGAAKAAGGDAQAGLPATGLAVPASNEPGR